MSRELIEWHKAGRDIPDHEVLIEVRAEQYKNELRTMAYRAYREMGIWPYPNGVY